MNPHNLRAAIWLTSSILLAIAAYISWRSGDGHVMNRAGSLVVVIAGVAGVAQILYDIASAKLQRDIQASPRSNLGPAASTPIERLSRRILSKTDERAVENVESDRLHVAVTIISAAALGEFLHGFGDLLFALVQFVAQ
jgi:hypothetical protein